MSNGNIVRVTNASHIRNLKFSDSCIYKKKGEKQVKYFLTEKYYDSTSNQYKKLLMGYFTYLFSDCLRNSLCIFHFRYFLGWPCLWLQIGWCCSRLSGLPASYTYILPLSPDSCTRSNTGLFGGS